jgi:hypothetical protein
VDPAALVLNDWPRRHGIRADGRGAGCIGVQRLPVAPVAVATRAALSHALIDGRAFTEFEHRPLPAPALPLLPRPRRHRSVGGGDGRILICNAWWVLGQEPDSYPGHSKSHRGQIGAATTAHSVRNRMESMPLMILIIM